ncbi:phosphodiester glycosidase family protein [Oleiharenicola lentus]|uniref:phosphodiester glycosidase family protein n=1 Tax=Oleiharenicola lentus TaxID=2508720 RepID=UPI003F67F60E
MPPAKNNRSLRFVWLFTATLFAHSAFGQTAAIESGVIDETTAAGPIRGHWAKVHLDQPRVHLTVTAPLATEVKAKDPANTEAHLRTVPEWAEKNQLTLAVNANFFSKVIQRAPDEKDPGWIPYLPVNLNGLSVSDGQIVSPANDAPSREPALMIFRGGRAVIDYAPDKIPTDLLCAVAGRGPSIGPKGQPGTLLVTAGKNTGATAQVEPTVRHPRTAAGVTVDGHTLILLVIDGRQPGHSVGCTLPELADVMIRLGAEQALNLDGGGSSTFYYRQPDGTVLHNKTPGGNWRPVGNHLGVSVSTP